MQSITAAGDSNFFMQPEALLLLVLDMLMKILFLPVFTTGQNTVERFCITIPKVQISYLMICLKMNHTNSVTQDHSFKGMKTT